MSPPHTPSPSTLKRKLSSVSTDVDVDQKIDQLKRLLPAEPYLLRLRSDVSFRLSDEQRRQWTAGTPFGPGEEELQYMTFIRRDARHGLLTTIEKSDTVSSQPRRQRPLERPGSSKAGETSGTMTPNAASVIPEKAAMTRSDDHPYHADSVQPVQPPTAKRQKTMSNATYSPFLAPASDKATTPVKKMSLGEYKARQQQKAAAAAADGSDKRANPTPAVVVVNATPPQSEGETIESTAHSIHQNTQWSICLAKNDDYVGDGDAACKICVSKHGEGDGDEDATCKICLSGDWQGNGDEARCEICFSTDWEGDHEDAVYLSSDGEGDGNEDVICENCFSRDWEGDGNEGVICQNCFSRDWEGDNEDDTYAVYLSSDREGDGNEVVICENCFSRDWEGHDNEDAACET
ncbi:MAG: hypothetical protein M1826_002197 [Phylliscum demangeonii]|nr:MAG: hypothetical protein M1826_002197 [Phylliscum demangeonii]